MSINKALDNILEGRLDEMRENFSAALSTKAVEKLEERKIEIAQNYFGQVFESKDKVDESVTGLALGTLAGLGLSAAGMKSGIIPKAVDKVSSALKKFKKKKSVKKD